MRFVNLVSDSIQLRPNQHYEMALPLKYSDVPLPNNKSQIEQRANYLKRRFLKNVLFFEDYKCFMGGMINNGFAEKVVTPDEEEGRV